MTDTIDAEAVDAELVVREQATPALFNTDDPVEIITKASRVANALKDVIVSQHMALRIGSSEYIKVEGWTTLGALVGVFPKVEWTRELTDGEGLSLGWEAAVVVVNGQGVEIGRAEAQCLRAERNWKGRDDFALRSMAQTRAMGKALRMPLGWIAVMAGYEATPAEEMPAPAVADDDVPFDDTGGQGQEALPAGISEAEAHGNTPGTAASTTREQRNEARREQLQEQLHTLAGWLGKKESQTAALIAKDRLKNEAKPAAHLAWLELQIANAEKAAGIELLQEELPV